MPKRVSRINPNTRTYADHDIERDEVLKDDYPVDEGAYDDDDEELWAGDDNAWNEEETPEEESSDAKDESSAYLEFLNEEVRVCIHINFKGYYTDIFQAQKFQNLDDPDSDEELGEESLLETPLDKIEPYALFRDALMSRCFAPLLMIINWPSPELNREQPQLYSQLTGNLSPEEQQVVQGVVQQADALAAQQAALAASVPGVVVNGATWE